MDWVGEPKVSRGVSERRFDLEVEGDVVPGVLWTPEDTSDGPRPLVLIGHGGSQHKRAPNVLALARRLVRRLGFAAAAIDGPNHGDRIEGGHDLTLEDVRRRMTEQSPEERQTAMRNARKEWARTLDELRNLPEIGEGPTGYWGLSMGTVIGLPFVAAEPRIDAAVLGLMGAPASSPGRAARSLEMPVLFLVQWDDELVPRDNAFSLFEKIGSKNKTMHVNPGVHVAVPPHEIFGSIDFFADHLKLSAPATQ